ncbi:MAG: cupin domain-containing protein [Chloroflexota bacterium]
MMIDAYEIKDLIEQQASENGRYFEFLRKQSMSMGIYRLPAQGKDYQEPHLEDEVYYVLSGKGMLHVEGVDRPVQPGSTLFVAAHEVHYFHTISEELVLLVFFAPAEAD